MRCGFLSSLPHLIPSKDSLKQAETACYEWENVGATQIVEIVAPLGANTATCHCRPGATSRLQNVFETWCICALRRKANVKPDQPRHELTWSLEKPITKLVRTMTSKHYYAKLSFHSTHYDSSFERRYVETEGGRKLKQMAVSDHRHGERKINPNWKEVLKNDNSNTSSPIFNTTLGTSHWNFSYQLHIMHHCFLFDIFWGLDLFSINILQYLYIQNIIRIIQSCIHTVNDWKFQNTDYAVLSAPGNPKTMTYTSSRKGSNLKISIWRKKRSLENCHEETLIYILPFETLGLLFFRYLNSQED